MAYFLPSYFQKRLLRYALSRLDFVETDELDLENLGITWGQRSVIELKDVGIQIKRLAVLLNLPPTILVTRARIAILRLTIPADLYASGIVVEIGGIDIEVKLHNAGRSQDATQTQTRTASAVSKGSKADRPRIALAAIHDPGGRKHGRMGHSTIIDGAIPTSEDLAASFLESEPLREREELQSIINSQSQYLQESTLSASGEGIGAPGGFELPTFVANFFKGIADRLSVEIKDITVTLEIHLSQAGVETTDYVKFMLKISEIALSGIGLQQQVAQNLDGRRCVSMHRIELILLSEPELFSQIAQSSTRSSPRLSRSQTKRSSASSKNTAADFLNPPTGTESVTQSLGESATGGSVASQSEDSSPDSSPAFASNVGLGLGSYTSESLKKRSMGDSAYQFASQNFSAVQGSQSVLGPRTVDNQINAEMLARTGQLDSSVIGDISPNGKSQDLSESKVFTHDEAESMYMSAVSHSLGDEPPSTAMPGAWGWSEPPIQENPVPSSEEIDLHSETPPTELQTEKSHIEEDFESPLQQLSQQPSPIQSKSSMQESPEEKYLDSVTKFLGSSHISKRIVLVDRISFFLPTQKPPERAFQTSTDQLQPTFPPLSPKNTKRASFADDSMYSQFSSQLFANPELNSNQTSHLRNRGIDRSPIQFSSSNGPSIDIGVISAAIDLPIGKLLVRTAQSLQPLTESSTNMEQPLTKKDSSTLQVFLSNAELNICDVVPELREFGESCTNTSDDTCGDDELLLRASLSRLNFQTLSDGITTRQQISISKISLGHVNRSILSFVDTVSVRNSVTASTLTLSDDLLVTVDSDQSSSQTQVQMKTLKLKVDLLQIDDFLSRSGGLSSLLDLGNSIISTSTVRGGSPKAKSPVTRPRSVRFKPAKRSSGENTTEAPAKINIRLAGMLLELVGSESSMLVRSSAVKVVYRRELLGLQIDWAELEGPLLLNRRGEGDIKIKIKNTRVEYQNSPKENDLERLLSMLTPSSDRDELEKEDDIMVDTLLRQRRKGGVLRVTLAALEAKVEGLQWQRHLAKLADEISRLSSVSKYLPEDDRPGILTLALIKKVELNLVLDPSIGTISLKVDLAEGAHVNIPSLMAAHITTLQLLRGDDHIIGEVVSSLEPRLAMSPPMIMCRFIADEMEPTVRLKLFNMNIEYKISTVTALLEIANAIQASADDMRNRPMSPVSSASSTGHAAGSGSTTHRRISLLIRDTALALNPMETSAKGLILLTDANLSFTSGDHQTTNAGLDIRKASMLVCDHYSGAVDAPKNTDPKLFFDESLQVQELVKSGFVPIAFLSAASANFKSLQQTSNRDQTTEVELGNGLLILETCADSTQTIIQVLNGLSPPAPPSKASKYRTEIVPIEDMLASFTGNAYVTEPGPEAGLQAMPGIEEDTEEDFDEDAGEEEDTGYLDRLWQSQSEAEADDMSESYLDSELAQSTASAAVSVAPVGVTESVMSSSSGGIVAHSMLDFRADHFARQSSVGGTAHRWDSRQNTYGLSNESNIRESPLRVKVRDFHVIWHLFDGYDWQGTRDRISKAVQDIEVKAATRRPRSNSRLSPRPDDDDESEIGDFLFNSIWIGVPANKDPKELTSAINRTIDDVASETGSYATGTTVTASPTRRPSGPRVRQKRLRLERSKHHKMAFELKGISADFVLFPPDSGEVESSIDVRIRDLEIIDQVPTSTWKKFATYMQDAGEREVDTNMVHLEILNVKPVADLTASELVLKVTILPLRLHVDQDALDFMSRFFEFKNENAKVSSTPSTPPFLQRVEVNPVKLRLDFKPKRVDYGALRSGRTTEFMNFIVLDRADMVLRRVILYGVSGFDRMGIMLNNIWSPDVRRNQLPGVLAGLAPIRSLVDVGSGVRDLVVVPMREYKKDGRIVRSIQKGALAFAKTTTKELVNLGAKLAIGTQTVLQNTEAMLGPGWEQDRRDEEDVDEEPTRQISLYADQPLGIVQGLRGAYASLERDLLLARDAIVAVPGEVMASGSATAAAKAVLRQSPTIILRPAIGASKAVGQTLLGAGNTLDRDNWRRMEEKYKRH